MDNPLVEARGLTVSYGAGEPVCAPVDFTVSPGEAVALVGLNGTGKTTLLRAVLGLLDPSGGSLQVMGRTVDERSAAFRAAVAYVIDVDAYYPALTLAEHLYLIAKAHAVPQPATRAKAMLAEFDLASHEHFVPSALSSGQRRRLLLCGALIRPFELLVLDEPEQRLDAQMRVRLAERLLAARRAGQGILFATHDPALLERAASSAVLLTESASQILSPAEAAAELTRMPT